MERPSTLQRLQALWESKQHFLSFQITEPWTSFWIRRKYDIRLLTPKDVHVTVPPGQAPACGLCREICCHGLRNTVTLRLRDIAVLLDLGLADAITADSPALPRKGRTSAMQEFVSSDFWRRFPKLRQTEAGRCYFLTAGDRCAIFENAPLACQRFPFALSPDRKTIFYSPRCRTHTIMEANHRAHQRHVAAVLANYNEMVKDIVLLHHGWRGLQLAGLARYIAR